MAIWKTGNGDGNYFNEDAKELVAAYHAPRQGNSWIYGRLWC